MPFLPLFTTMTDWKEKYMRLRDEHNDLKLAFNSKVEEVKRSNVQLTKIENLLKMKDKMDAAAGGGYASALARAEQEKIIKNGKYNPLEGEDHQKALRREGRAVGEER